MALILNIETTSPICSLALCESNGQLVSILENREQTSHASRITILIDQLLTESGKSLSDLVAVAVSSGPGSYTGLRIGTAVAKGLCYTLDIPLISVDTLRSLTIAVEVKKSSGLLCPMIDARRLEVYTALFKDDKLIRKPAAIIIDAAFLEKELKEQPIYFFGSGSAKCKELIQHPNALFIADIENSSEHMFPFSCQKLKESNFEDTAYYDPFYLKNQYISTP